MCFYLYIFMFVCSLFVHKRSHILCFSLMRPPLRCGECWKGWAELPAPGKNVWTEATVVQTLLWSATRQAAALRAQRSPQVVLRLLLERKWHTDGHLTYETQTIHFRNWWWLSDRPLVEVKTYLSWAFPYHWVTAWLVHKTLCAKEGCLSVFSFVHHH